MEREPPLRTSPAARRYQSPRTVRQATLCPVLPLHPIFTTARSPRVTARGLPRAAMSRARWAQTGGASPSTRPAVPARGLAPPSLACAWRGRCRTRKTPMNAFIGRMFRTLSTSPVCILVWSTQVACYPTGANLSSSKASIVVTGANPSRDHRLLQQNGRQEILESIRYP